MPPDTTGGAPIAPTQQMTAPAQAPMSVDQLQGLIQQNAQTTASDIQAEPTIAANQRALIFGNDPTLSSLQSNEASKIQELFAHDQMLSQNYGAPVNQPAPPNPSGVATSAPTSTGAPGTLVPNASNPQFGAENPLAAGYILNPYYAEENMAKQDATTMSELTDIQNQAQQRREVLGNVLDNVMKIYQSHLDTEKYLSDTYQTELNSKLQQQDQSLKTRQELLAEAQAGYKFDPTSGTFGIMGLGDLLPGMGGTGTGTSGVADERKQLQDIVNSLPPQSPLRQHFEDAWKQETGLPLFPQQALSTADRGDLSNTITTLNAVDNVLSTMQKYGGKFPSGPMASMDQFLGQHGLPSFANTDELTALNQLTQLQGLGDRELIGGRLTGYLLNVLGPAFPGIQKGTKLNTAQLNNMKLTLMNGLNSLAKYQGYDNAAQMLTDQGIKIPGPMAGTITIKNNKTGEVRYITKDQASQYGL